MVDVSNPMTMSQPTTNFRTQKAAFDFQKLFGIFREGAIINAQAQVFRRGIVHGQESFRDFAKGLPQFLCGEIGLSLEFSDKLPDETNRFVQFFGCFERGRNFQHDDLGG
jgi:hypothetical protein